MQLLHKRVRVSVGYELGQYGESFNRQKLFELRCTHNYQENSNMLHTCTNFAQILTRYQYTTL